MNFSHPYYKLGNRIFTTIRRKNSLKFGDIEPIKLKNKFQFNAKILHIQKIKVSMLPEGILLMDCLYPKCKIETKADCLNLIQSFYGDKIDFEKEDFHLILLKRMDSKITDFIK
jgi:hypothetical protein